MLRPDLLISSDNFLFTNTDSPFVLIESKLQSDLTSNQYVGYPEIKSIYKENVAIILVSNYFKKEHLDYFDKVVSWTNVFEIAKDYISNHSNQYERVILQELLNTFYEFGIDYNKFLFAGSLRGESKGILSNYIVLLLRKLFCHCYSSMFFKKKTIQK